MRGTMMRYGEEACDGKIDPFACASCWSHGRGAPKSLALALSAVPPRFASALGRVAPESRIVTALSASVFASLRGTEFAEMIANADRVIAVCQWLYDALARNGVPAAKLVLSRQGVDPAFAVAASRMAQSGLRPQVSEGVFRLLYLGRWHPVKGIDTLVSAVRAIRKSVPFELVIHGVGEGPEERAYEAIVRRLAKGDERIRIAAPVARDRLADTLSNASALAVPSRWMETGPLVVLEAKAVGLPIIGSRLGGISELVREPHDGLLVASGEVRAWTAALLRMVDHFPASKLRRCASVRTMADAAKDMATLYRDLCAAD